MQWKARLLKWVFLAIFLVLTAFSWGIRQKRALAQSNPPEPKAETSRRTSAQDPRLRGAYRFERNGWIYVHLQGSPEQIGFQHGYLLAPEIADAFAAVKLEDTHMSRHDWAFFRHAAHEMLWPKIDQEYQAELQGIVEGLEAHGAPLSIDDVVALNAFEELPAYYIPWYDAQRGIPSAEPPIRTDHCSAFVATGSYTRNHGIVMGHNNWTTYVDGERWRILFDITPQRGYRILMDGFPGVISSDDDFGMNAGGLMVSETTISDFYGWDPNGKPEFVRSREALQYAGSIDDYVRIMLEGNNGGYANDWLLGDRKSGEIARFELGLKHHQVQRTTDGYFVGSNFPSDPQLAADETTFHSDDPSNSANARHARWDELMKQYKGRIDTQLAEQFEADHFDSYAQSEGADERTLCGHIDASPRGASPHDPFGAVQGKVTDSEMAARMSLIARLGHPCGEGFSVKPFLAAHPEFDWEAPILRDMPAYPWTTFSAGEQP